MDKDFRILERRLALSEPVLDLTSTPIVPGVKKLDVTLPEALRSESLLSPVCHYCGTKLIRMPSCWQCPLDGDVSGCS